MFRPYENICVTFSFFIMSLYLLVNITSEIVIMDKPDGEFFTVFLRLLANSGLDSSLSSYFCDFP